MLHWQSRRWQLVQVCRHTHTDDEQPGCCFYFAQYRGYTKLHLQTFDEKLKPIGKAREIDSLPGLKDLTFKKFRIITSLDKSKTMVYQPHYTEGNLTHIKALCFDKNMRLLYRRRIEPPRSEKLTKLRKTIVDNEGNGYWVVYETTRQHRRKDVVKTNFHLLKYSVGQKELKQLPLDINLPLLNGLKVEIDNQNGQLMLSGLYALHDDEGAKGIFYQTYDISSETSLVLTFTPFNAELIRGITGKDSSANFDGLYSFSIDRVLPKFDGGAIVIAESRFDNSESVQMTSIVGSTTPSFRTVNIIYFNDVVIFSLDPDGAIEWHSILRKKQVSEDDDGFYSSYCLMMHEDKLRFIYNEEIFPKTNINEYGLTVAGEQRRNTIFNSGDFNIMLAPQLARQVTGNELIIPSYRRNYLRLLKLTY